MQLQLKCDCQGPELNLFTIWPTRGQSSLGKEMATAHFSSSGNTANVILSPQPSSGHRYLACRRVEGSRSSDNPLPGQKITIKSVPFVSGPLTPLAIEEPLSLWKWFHCYSPNCNMNSMCLHLPIIILAQSPGVMTIPILHIYDAKLLPGPFLGFQKQYELSPPTL